MRRLSLAMLCALIALLFSVGFPTIRQKPRPGMHHGTQCQGPTRPRDR